MRKTPVTSLAWAAAGLAAALFSCTPAAAQSAPFVYDAQVTTSPSQIVAANNARRSIMFCNPNASGAVAICPVTSRRTGSAITCAFNGRGSVTIPITTCFSLQAAPGSAAPLPSAWNGIASSGTLNITIFEIE